MKNLEQRRSRYLQDALPTRLGGSAANLSRITSFSKHAGGQPLVADVFLESRWFIEWTALEFEVVKAAELVNLQVQLALWDLESRESREDENWRSALAGKAMQWSQRILEMSGLLKAA
ncbi:MAG: hypothetical protein ONB46_12605 [candidate division KSB1 bacterium]|nr:hypothetical protein [candidate division KSB1 bacterium]MDZ7366559.1 hypothetical protein [candidate division KSB1 bacterium]MDZ7405958.1 hypothetical protein [candidate division KSB1 bacterium]